MSGDENPTKDFRYPYEKNAEKPSQIGRFLGGIRLAGLCFLGGVLFLRKKSFYVFLCPKLSDIHQAGQDAVCSH